MTKHARGECTGPTGSPPCRVCVREGRQRRPGAGRPRVGGVRMSLTLPAAHAEALDALAAAEGVSRATVIRRALGDWLA